MSRKNGRNRRPLNPEAIAALDNFKMEAAQELGLYNKPENKHDFKTRLDQYKYEIADNLGISSQVKQEGWGNVPSKDCGAIGGRMGGKLGGNMVRKMIAMSENEMSGELAPKTPEGGEINGKEK